MTCRVIIGRNPLEAESYEIHDGVENLCEFLMEQFPTWPDGARIYHEHVSQVTDVTPSDEASIARLNELDSDVYVVVYPEGVVALLILVVIAVVALVAVVAFTKPSVPNVAADASARNQQQTSPNNELAARTNRARPAARIPDIYGIVRSTPDLISPTYTYYEGNRKVEISYMCIGRGEYAIYDVKDGDTWLSYIPGSAAAFYGPNQSPKNGAPFYSVGAAIDDPLMRASKVEQVVGQELRPPNAANVTGESNIKFQYPDRIYNNVGINFQDKFLPYDQVYISGATYSGPSGSISTNQIARYVANGSYPYIEWQGDDPRNYFEPNDLLYISGAQVTGLRKPTTVVYSGLARFRSNGRIYFSSNHPQEQGYDFRTAKDVIVSNATLNFDFNGTYTVVAKTSNTLTLSSPALYNGWWAYINGETEFKEATVRGITGNFKFTESGQIIAESGNFNDVIVNQTVTVTGADYSHILNGTYNLESMSAGQDYWQLTNPQNVNAEWNEIKDYTVEIWVTVSQTHSTDTYAMDFGGTYPIYSMDANRIYLYNPGPANNWWNYLTDLVNDRTEYSSADSFYTPNPPRTISLDGYYTIVSVGLYEIILSNPTAVSDDWYKLQFFSGEEIIPVSPYIGTTGGNWIGPFTLANPDLVWIYTSFVAQNGLYKDDGKEQTRAQVQVEFLSYQMNEAATTTTGNYQIWSPTLTGSAVQRDTVAYTAKVALSYPGPQLIYARRATAKDTTFEGQVVDTVKWEDVWMLAHETRQHFGNVTTVMTKTYATGGALALKERKLNCLVGRKIPIITGWSGTYPNYQPVYAADLQVTDDARQIFCALSLDPFFGNRATEEVDFNGIFTAGANVYLYFNSYDAIRFSYTFDNVNISYEEAAAAIGNAAFCTVYRQGNVIKWKPEIATADSTLLFNHRNKIPDTETRTVRFGAQNDYDSVQLEWVNPEDDAIETFFIPEDQSGVAPRKVETIGIRNISQATWHAWRTYYKTLYQHTAVEFEATQEAAILIQKDRVLVADNTRADTQDGEIWDQDVLQLTLSQEVVLKSNVTYTIFIQHTDGTVEGIPITAVPDILDISRNTYFRADGGVRFPVAADAGLFSPGDVVTISVTSFNDPVTGLVNLDGTYTVESIDALTGIVKFVNPALVDNDWTRITTVESVLRVGVNYDSNRYSKRKVNLQYAPRLPLNLDPESYARATYVIRGSDEVAPTAFMVQETRPKDNFTYTVSLVNYDSRFYYMDDLEFWLNFNDQTFRDASARAHAVSISTSAGKARISYDNDRASYTFDNLHNASSAWVRSSDLNSHPFTRYTKAAWVKMVGGFDAYFLSNPYEQFRCNGTGRIIAGHHPVLTGISFVGFPVDNQWHHICCTYDYSQQGGRLRIYLDGVLKAQRINVPQPFISILDPIGYNNAGVIYGRADDVRYWKKEFTPEQVAELFNSTR